MAKTILFKHEDYWSIWIGAFLLLLGLLLFALTTPEAYRQEHQALEQQMAAESAAAPYRTVAWHQAFDQQQQIKGIGEPAGRFLKQFTGKPGGWTDNPLHAFGLSPARSRTQQERLKAQYDQALQQEATALERALLLDREAAAAGYRDEARNRSAAEAIEAWRTAKKALSAVKSKYEARPYSQWPSLLGLVLFLGALFTLGASVMGASARQVFLGFFFVFGLGLISYLLAGQASMKALGIGYAAWAIVLGLLISNTVGVPQWVKPALMTEFYIKTGLVLLGAEILFGKILAIGLPGLFVAWVVTPVVLVTTYWFGQKVLKISSRTLNMTISADMSVCGVLAAVATAAACKATKEELTLSIGLSMVFTSVMMIVLPLFINWVGIPEVLGGAWIGGTIDATGAVVAAGAFLGEKALNVAATIKMIQNMLIGLIAFGVAVYFATKVEKTDTVRIGWNEIWLRFPKFILGFVGASVLFSILHASLGDGPAYTLLEEGVLGGFTKNLRGWLFCLAFVSIGLSTNFKALKAYFHGGRPLVLYVCGQALNLGLTLLMAYIMFYKVFPHITANI